jgi:two-component system, LytTR family, sensor kinase
MPTRGGLRRGIALLMMLPLGAVYAVLIWHSEHTSALNAALCGLVTAAIAAASLGLAHVIEIALATRRGAAPVGASAHVALAVLFSGVWAGAITSLIAYGAPRRLTWYVHTAFGWQLLLGILVYAVVAGQRHLERAHRALQEREAAVLRAELHALQARLNPHFLFNTLNSIAALVRSDPDAADAALERLSSLLRNVLRVDVTDSQDILLETELAFVRNYLELEKLRLGDRLRVIEDVDPEALDELLPPLTLQLLVENAIRHGIERRPLGGTLTIFVGSSEGALRLEIGDDGAGASPDEVERAHASGALGLRLVRERLRARYGARSHVELVTSPGNGFVARLTLPTAHRVPV